MYSCIDGISIHAPHTGRDAGRLVVCGRGSIFQSTRPIRGATLTTLEVEQKEIISIHAPHTGRDCRSLAAAQKWLISIHAPHTGRDGIRGKRGFL